MENKKHAPTHTANHQILNFFKCPQFGGTEYDRGSERTYRGEGRIKISGYYEIH